MAVSGSIANPDFNIATGATKRKSPGDNLLSNMISTSPAAVTTYFYRVIATGVRATTTSLTSIPAGAVIEGITTT